MRRHDHSAPGRLSMDPDLYPIRAYRPGPFRLSDWVVDWWAGGGGTLGRLLRLAALPVEAGFRRVTGFRNRMYDVGVLPLQRAPVPVISVGNLTVGGSGKTPLSAWLVRGLKTRGESPALVSRGYGDDEIVLHRRWNPDSPVLAEEDRAYAAWKAAKKGASVVVLDDGFQHRRLGRELDVVLVPASTPSRVRLLPRGPFREPLAAVGRAGVVVITQKGLGESSLEIEGRLDPYLREPPVRVAFVPAGWSDLQGVPAEGPEGDFLGVCGIGDPAGFSRTLLDATGRPGELMIFPDHHDYGWPEIQEIQNRLGSRTLVTTEKDAVKLAAYADGLRGARVLKLKVEILEGEERLWRHVTAVLRPTKDPS